MLGRSADPSKIDGGVSRRRVIVGAFILIFFTSSLTYAVTSLRYRGLLGQLAGGIDNVTTMEELAKSPGFNRFVSILTLVRNQYVDKVALEKLMQGASEGAVGALNDPYSSFFNAKEFEDFHVQTDGMYGGIGVQVTDEGKYIVVVGAFPGTPGATTSFEGAGQGDPRGLQPKDRLIKVGDLDVVGAKVSQVVDLIKGEPGTVVRLIVLRQRRDEPDRQLTFNVTRARITVPTTRVVMLTPAIGYLQISQFLENTSAQVRRELEGLKARGARALILDLRHNPGGRLDASVEIAGLFVPRGPVVSVIHRSGTRETFTSSNPTGLGMPLVVLVDEATASAAEILAGAIQDRKVGTLVGTNTFGKGLVQQIWDLKDGTGLKLTVSKYITPNGRDINRKVVDPDTGEQKGGLTPDIAVERPDDVQFGVIEKDPQLAKAVEVVQRAIQGRDRVAADGAAR